MEDSPRSTERKLTITEKGIKDSICPECHVAVLHYYQEKFYLKCPICGFIRLLSNHPNFGKV